MRISSDPKRRETTKRVEAFKQECRNLKEYEQLEADAKQHAEELGNRIAGPRSPVWEKTGMAVSYTNNEPSSLIEDRDKWIERAVIYHCIRCWIFKRIMSIRPPVIAHYVARVCLNGESIQAAADSVDMDPKALSVMIYNAISNVMDDQAVADLTDMKNKVADNTIDIG